MNWLNLIGIAVIAVLLAYKINYLIRYFKNKENINPLKTMQGFVGWWIGLALEAVSALFITVYKIPGYYFQLLDLMLSVIIISVIDARSKIIPNYLMVALLLSQIICAFTFAKTYLDIWNVVLSIIVLGVLMLASKISKEQIGMGDVKLITAVNLIYGLSFTMYSFMFALIIMLVCMIPLLILKRIKLKSQLPFAPFYTLGIIAYIILSLI